MRFFRSEKTLRQWQARCGVPDGAQLTVSQIWELSQVWYGPRLEVGFHGRTVPQVEAIFRSLGLTSDFWYSNTPK